jgi:multidrug transporter EmrE-like cation transporter
MSLTAALLLIGYILALTGANITLVYVNQFSGWKYYGLFIVANVIGFFCPLCMMFALKHTRPLLAYSLGIGGGFCFLQLANYRLFQQTLSAPQWIGVFCVCAGVVLLQIK